MPDEPNPPRLVSEVGLPRPGTGGLYAVKVGDGLVKFGRSHNLAVRLLSHHRAVKHLGMEFEAAWVECPTSVCNERDLLARLDRSGFERSPSSEAYAISWPVAVRFLAAAGRRVAQ